MMIAPAEWSLLVRHEGKRLCQLSINFTMLDIENESLDIRIAMLQTKCMSRTRRLRQKINVEHIGKNMVATKTPN